MMPRLIARLDIKNEYVIKGIHLEGLRKVGDPLELATQYYKQGVDEILFMDAVASLYDRNNIFEIMRKAAKKSFIPIAIGGGIRSIDDAYKALDAGADKIVINTSAINDIRIVEKVSSRFGSQAMVASIEAKQTYPNQWEAYIDNGREPTGLDALSWSKSLVSAGAGEIIVTSVDYEGTKKGFDIELATKIIPNTSIPVIISGGCGKLSHINELIEKCEPSGIAIASCFHYHVFTPKIAKASIQ